MKSTTRPRVVTSGLFVPRQSLVVQLTALDCSSGVRGGLLKNALLPVTSLRESNFKRWVRMRTLLQANRLVLVPESEDEQAALGSWRGRHSNFVFAVSPNSSMAQRWLRSDLVPRPAASPCFETRRSAYTIEQAAGPRARCAPPCNAYARVEVYFPVAIGPALQWSRAFRHLAQVNPG
jgi:hypothetical protein